MKFSSFIKEKFSELIHIPGHKKLKELKIIPSIQEKINKNYSLFITQKNVQKLNISPFHSIKKSLLRPSYKNFKKLNILSYQSRTKNHQKWKISSFHPRRKIAKNHPFFQVRKVYNIFFKDFPVPGLRNWLGQQNILFFSVQKKLICRLNQILIILSKILLNKPN